MDAVGKRQFMLLSLIFSFVVGIYAEGACRLLLDIVKLKSEVQFTFHPVQSFTVEVEISKS